MRTIVHISDLHFGRHSQPLAEALSTSVHGNRPDLIVVSGDFTQRARHSEFAQAQRFLSLLTEPKLLVPGNHDVPLYDVFRRFLSPFKKYDHYIGAIGQPDNFYRDEEIAVLGINTARRFTGKNGRISRDQIAHISRVFDAVPGSVFKVIVTHHPLASPEAESLLELAGRSRAAIKAIEDAGVHLLLSGHHHRALSGHHSSAATEGTVQVIDEGSILVLHAGTAISTRTRGTEGNSYNLIQIDKQRVSVSVLEGTEGGYFRQKGQLAYIFDGGRWRSNSARS
jgi:3',5'-cyclic AMP phosphodiesterase CpdA